MPLGRKLCNVIFKGLGWRKKNPIIVSNQFDKDRDWGIMDSSVQHVAGWINNPDHQEVCLSALGQN